MSKEEICKKRDKLLVLINQLAKQKYDARILLPEFYRLTEEYKKCGGRPAPYKGPLLKSYWDNPVNYCNEYLNHWKIFSVENGVVDRRYVKVSDSKPPIPPKESAKTVDINYYRINITWEGDINVQFVERFFKEMCIPQDKQLDDHSLAYIYKGSSDGFKMLKRAINVIGNMMFPDNSFAVYGKEIKK